MCFDFDVRKLEVLVLNSKPVLKKTGGSELSLSSEIRKHFSLFVCSQNQGNQAFILFHPCRMNVACRKDCGK